MKQYFLLFFFLVNTLLQATPIDPYKNIHYFELDNGLKVYLLSDKKAVNTQIDLSVKVGLRVENEENAGISHLVEHLIFRDQRVKHHDYVDYLKESGATYVNGYTNPYRTNYVATIDAKKSYFLVQEFAKMVFDKNVTQEDLDVERRALQNEIGELKWYNYPAYKIKTLYKFISSKFPDDADIYRDSFGLQKEKEDFSSYIYKRNNTKFRLEQVLQHYKEYYYPKNMTLQVVGNFDVETMKELIQNTYGRVDFEGTKTTHELAYDAQLKEKAYSIVSSGVSDKNMAYIGARYILDSYKKYLTFYAYSEHLSSKMQKLLRNKLGQTYSISPYNESSRNAALSGIVLESLHDDFKENLAIIQKQIADDVVGIPHSEIEEALAQSELYYASKEHDSETLMDLVGTLKYLHEYQNVYDKTPYEIFKEITPKYFQELVSASFVDKYSYLFIYRDYYFFPFDMILLSFLMIFGVIYFFKKSAELELLKRGIAYTTRDIILTRRITPVFISIGVFVLIFIMGIFLSEWLRYFAGYILFEDGHYFDTIGQPYNYLVEIIDFISFMVFYVLITYTLFRGFYIKVDLTKKQLNIAGASLRTINKEDILEIKKVAWSLDKTFKICGVSPLFFKPLVMIKHKSGICYLRAKKSDELEEDLNEWLQE